MTENQNAAIADSAASGIDSKGMSQFSGKFALVLAVLLVIAMAVSYILSFAAPPLLDEKFLLHWLKELPKLHGSSGFSGFMSWQGFDAADSWGPTSKIFLLAASTIFSKNIFFYKLLMFLLHIGCTAFTYLCSRRILQSRLAAFFAASLFAFYPLHFEATVWLGGIAAELAALFFLFAFYVFLDMRTAKLKWSRVAVIAAAMFLAVSSSAVVWPACIVFAIYELFDFIFPASNENRSSKDLTSSLITILIPIMVTGVYLAASGMVGPALWPDFQLKKSLVFFKHVFLPINEINWHKYSREYIGLYTLYGFSALALLPGLFLSPQIRRGILISLLLFFTMAIPLVGIAATDSLLYGERWLYPASFGVCCLLAAALSGLINLPGKLKYAGIAYGSVLCLLLSIFFFRHLWNENGSNLSYARVARNVQKSMRILQEKEHSPLLIVRDLPEKMSIIPMFSPRGPVLFDPQSGLLRSNPVPDGRLKELLRTEELKGSVYRWEPDMKSFVQLDHFASTAIMPESINAEGVLPRMQPPIEVYKNVHMSPDKTQIEMESNSENGPVISLNPNELSTLDGDYLYVDAQVDAPASYASPRIELHWQTRVHMNYEKRERFAYADAIVNDGKTHRYLLSLRGNGWTTGGMPTIVALGFPAGSKVRLSGMGLVRNAKDIAQLKDATDPSVFADQAHNRFTPPYFNYPVDPRLGMIALSSNAKEISAEYSVAEIPDADGVSIELSYPNRSFDDANSNHLSGQTYKTFSQSGKSARITIPIADLPGPGVYSLRVIARSASGACLGQFSNHLCYQVPRVPREN